jgi:hypothetical protein
MIDLVKYVFIIGKPLQPFVTPLFNSTQYFKNQHVGLNSELS